MNAKTTRTAAVTTDIFGTTLTLNFANGKELQIDTTTLHADIVQQAILHGLKQKLVDAAAIARDTETGKTATIDDKYQAVKTVFDRITSATPSWNAVREGEQKQQGGIFVRALMELTGKSREATQAAIETYTKEQVAALKKNPRVLAIIQRMEREKVQDDQLGEDLLAQLGA